MQLLAVCGVILCELLVVVRYTTQIRARKISPTLSTWIIFVAGTISSTTTYLVAEERAFVPGLLIITDVCATSLICGAVLMWGKRTVRFMPFEKWYLVGLGAAAGYGLMFGAWGSNIFTQALITVGYFPTIQNLVKTRRNTESFTAWLLVCASALCSLPLTLENGNALAVLYSVRTFVSVAVVLGIMWYFQHQQRRVRT